MEHSQMTFTSSSGFGIDIMLYEAKSFFSPCLVHAMLEWLKNKCFLIRLNIDDKEDFAYCCPKAYK